MARRGIVRSFQKTNILKSLTVFENVLTGHYLEARQSLWQTFFPGRRGARDRGLGARERGPHRRDHGSGAPHGHARGRPVVRRTAAAGGGPGAGRQARGC